MHRRSFLKFLSFLPLAIPALPWLLKSKGTPFLNKQKVAWKFHTGAAIIDTERMVIPSSPGAMRHADVQKLISDRIDGKLVEVLERNFHRIDTEGS